MNIRLRKLDNGLQQIYRLSFTGANNKTTFVDLWGDELKEVEELINIEFGVFK